MARTQKKDAAILETTEVKPVMPQDGLADFSIIIYRDLRKALSYRRSDCYRILLTERPYIIKKNRKKYLVESPAVVFDLPEVQYIFEEKEVPGMTCILGKKYGDKDFQRCIKELLKGLKERQHNCFLLDEQRQPVFEYYFKRLFEESQEDFPERTAVIEGLLKMMVADLLRIREQEAVKPAPTVAEEFLRMLQNQFPIDSPEQPLEYKNPKDFAAYFQIHVNHLNFSVKKEYGMTTTQMIQEYVLHEACELLKNTKWSSSDISRALGFEYPQHFNIYFRKKMGQSPLQYRKNN